MNFAAIGRVFAPLALALAATYLEGVDQGRWTLTRELPLMVPLSSKPFSSKTAPVKPGQYLPTGELLTLMLTPAI